MSAYVLIGELMIIKSEFNENGKNLQDIIEEYLIDFYYEFYDANLS